MELKEQTMPGREQYSFRLLKAKAQCRKLFPDMPMAKPRYAKILIANTPELEDRRQDVYAALNDHTADFDILSKFERLVFDVIPHE